MSIINITRVSIIHFVNIKSNSALLYKKGHNLLTSAFPQKNVTLIKVPCMSRTEPKETKK